MNKRDLKKLKIDSSYVISPDRFLSMFGIECDNLSKINIHDLHYILNDHLYHVGVNQISAEKIYRGEILLIGTLNNFKPYYRPILYKVNVSDKITDTVIVDESKDVDISLAELCILYAQASESEELNSYLDEIYARGNIDLKMELEPSRSKIYCYSNKDRFQ